MRTLISFLSLPLWLCAIAVWFGGGIALALHGSPAFWVWLAANSLFLFCHDKRRLCVAFTIIAAVAGVLLAAAGPARAEKHERYFGAFAEAFRITAEGDYSTPQKLATLFCAGAISGYLENVLERRRILPEDKANAEKQYAQCVLQLTAGGGK